MRYHCSACHNVIDAAEPPHACPRCHAEAGIEAEHTVPMPMKLFAALLGSAIAVSSAIAVFGLLSRAA